MDSASERYMNNEDGGSVGYIGNSRYGWYDPEVPPGEGPSDLYDREFFNITFNESAYRLGEVVGYSKVRYIPLSQEDETAMRWLQYTINLLGDPELPIRTETPRNFSILMPSQIPARKQTLVISVSEIGYDNGSVQVRNATVCIMKSGEVYDVSKTNASGLAEFTIDPDAGALDVTVTKENYRVYEGVIDSYSVPDIYVNTTGWWRDGGALNASMTPIQAGVDNATVGETVFVWNGTYHENVDITKQLTLEGEGAGMVTVAASSTGHVVEVTADHVNISGFTATAIAKSGAAIHLRNADHCNVSGNTASHSHDGIYLDSSSNNTLTNNTAVGNGCGIHFCNADDNIIICNWVHDNMYAGFQLVSGSRDNNISYNNIIANGGYNTTSGGYEYQFKNCQSDKVNATNNWWGTTDNNIINASIYDWWDDYGNGIVAHLPILGQPATCAPDKPDRPVFTTTDAVIALEIAVGSHPPDPLWDVSVDDSVTSLDALMILQAAAGAIKL